MGLLTPEAQRVVNRYGSIIPFRDTFGSDKAFFEWAFGEGTWTHAEENLPRTLREARDMVDADLKRR